MTINERGDRLTLATGRVVPSYGGTIGLCLLTDGCEPRLAYGYDGNIRAAHETDSDGDDALSIAECREIAEHMIAAWREYMNNLPEAAP